jgi:hypothetical protein
MLPSVLAPGPHHPHPSTLNFCPRFQLPQHTTTATPIRTMAARAATRNLRIGTLVLPAASEPKLTDHLKV